MRVFCYKLFWLVFILSLFAERGAAQVRSIKAQTENGLAITVWMNERPARMGKDVEVHFRVENSGSKTVHLVRKEHLEVDISGSEFIVNPYTVGPDEKGETDYSFVSIRKGAIHRGKFVIPAQKIDRDGVWYVEVELAFVDDIQGLQPRKLPSRDPVAFRGLLFQRATPIRLGKLYLLVE